MPNTAPSIYKAALRAAGRAIATTPRSWMAFAAAVQGHHGAPLAGLRHQEQQVVGSTACLQRRVSAAVLGSTELHARIARMAWLHRSCCQANGGRSWPSSQRSFAQRMSCMLSGAVSKYGNVLSVASRAAVRLSVSSRVQFVLVTRMVDGVKMVDFSNTVPSSNALATLITASCVAPRVSLSIARKCGPKSAGFCEECRLPSSARISFPFPRYQ